MQKITFQDTTVLKKPYINFNGIEYEVQDGSYDGGTDLNASTFNTMQNNIETTINDIQAQLNHIIKNNSIRSFASVETNEAPATTVEEKKNEITTGSLIVNIELEQ